MDRLAPVRMVVRSEKWPRAANVAVSLLMVVIGALAWQDEESLVALLFWIGATANLSYEVVLVVRDRYPGRGPHRS